MENSLFIFCFLTQKTVALYSVHDNYKLFEVGRLKICEILLDFTIQPKNQIKEEIKLFLEVKYNVK